MWKQPGGSMQNMLSPVLATRLDSLTGIRTVAVMLVFWHHASEQWSGLSSGMVGVSLFYLLSGFVMAWTDQPTDTPWLFYRRRFARIYPAYFVAVLLSIGLLAYRGTLTVTDFAAFTLFQSWVPIEDVYFAANAVFWSLSVETFFYLVFPWLRLLTRRLATNGLVALGICATAASLLIAGVGSLLPFTETTAWAVVAFPPSRLPEFIVGVAAGSLMARGWRPVLSLWLTIPLACAAVTAALFAPEALSRYGVTLIPFTMLIVSLAAADLATSRVFTQWPTVVKLGIWSYCFYLIHNQVLQVTVNVGERLGIPLGASTLVALACSLVAAWMLHTLVERPLEKRLRPAGRERLDTD